MGKLTIGQVIESTNCGSYEVIELLPKSMAKVRFLETGCEEIRQRHSVEKGNVADSSLTKYSKKYKIGMIFSSKNYGKYEITKVLPEYYVEIRFIETGYTVTIAMNNIATGYIKDPFVKSVQGVACIGEGEYSSKKDGKHHFAYKTWHDMIRRCYDENHKDSPAYMKRGVTVCEEWLNFQNFAKWFDENYKEGFKLDKDLTIPGCKTYSPDTCAYIPEYINIFVNGTTPSKKGMPQGVNMIDGKYVARLGTKEGRKYLGYFPTKEEAFLVYKAAKEKHVKEVALDAYEKGEISQIIYENLMNWRVET